MAPPPVPEELWEEILLRLPPDDPASFLRVSLVSKQWRRIISRRGFLRRLGELHRAPPVLGFFHDCTDEGNRTVGVAFAPTAASALSLPIPSVRRGGVLDCRHGRVLLHRSERELLVWEPITGYQRILPYCPQLFCVQNSAAAVMCAADGCDHCSCHGGPFRVVAVYFTHEEEDEHEEGRYTSFTSARVYSSETAAWGEETSVLQCYSAVDPSKASRLAGNSLYFQCEEGDKVFKYDLSAHTLAELDLGHNAGIIIQAEDGELGFAVINYHYYAGQWKYPLQLKSWEEGAGWIPRRTIHLEDVLPPAASRFVTVIGFAEGTNIIFLETNGGIYTIEFNSGRVRKVPGVLGYNTLYPFMSFYTPGRRTGIQVDAREQSKQTKLMLLETDASSWSSSMHL